MKKALIIFIIIVLIIAAIVLGISELSRYYTVTGTIVEIDEHGVYIGCGKIEEETNRHKGYYDFSSKQKSNQKIKFKDEKNHKISEKDLKVGDIIKINGKKDEIEIAIAYSIEPLYNIKSVRIIGQDLEGAVDTDIFNNSSNVSFMINEFTNKGITLTITDKNKRPYKYNDDYTIYKKVKSEPQTMKSHSSGNLKQYKPQAMKQVTISATSIPPKLPSQPQEAVYNKLEELKKISQITSQETLKFDKKLSSNIIMKKYDWSNMYGKLEKGNYELRFNIKQRGLYFVNIYFSIDEEGSVSYENPVIDIYKIQK